MPQRHSQDAVALLSPEEQQQQDRDPDSKPESFDLESGQDHASPPKDQNIDLEYSVPSAVKFTWLGAYFLFSLGLTLYNKFVLEGFNYPWLLTFLHSSFASIGTFAMYQFGYFKLSRLGRKEHLALVAFSALFTSNIAASNLSLAMVSVPFYQTIRMLCPIFTILIYRGWYGRTYTTMTYLSLVPLIIGATMTTAGEMRFSDAGFIVTIVGVILAALKTIVTNRFMTGSLALPPMEFLMRMSPLAAIQALVCAAATGEVADFHNTFKTGDVSVAPAFASFFGNGFLALLLNIASFNTNKLAGALTMTVCGNMKQCLTVALGIFLFHVTVDLLNGAGMAVTMLGAAIYSKAELDNKNKKQQQQQEAQYKPVEQR